MTSDPTTREEETAARRRDMVERQLAARGIRRRAVLEAMREVPREAFVPPGMRDRAYDDGPLPIGEGQTISQPYVVALMTESLEPEPEDRALEIGTGSGYGAAVLSRVVAEVYTVERRESLADAARRRLGELGYDNVEVVSADGTRGWLEAAPYDGIVVTAGAPEVPDSLRRQLAQGGRLVLPVGSAHVQELQRVRRVGEERWETERLDAVRFVPLVGEEGWPAGAES